MENVEEEEDSGIVKCPNREAHDKRMRCWDRTQATVTTNLYLLFDGVLLQWFVNDLDQLARQEAEDANLNHVKNKL